ncbi:MAG TPA: winged helix-turn-helix domain-containing protein [Acidimicrobiales bacterium]|nr:winged helix-turn-helix domain-containing protein [Acidimicrobiales bacterium]
MPAVAVIDDPSAAVVALDPVRSRMLATLAHEPASAAGLALKLGIARQRVGYHLRALEQHGLVAETEQRQHGGLTERIFSASATSYVVSPAAMGDAGTDPSGVADRMSGAYLIALAARAVREVGVMLRGAHASNRHLATLSVDTEVCFRSAEDRAAFAEELAAAVRALAARYHTESRGGRWYRIVALVHPRPQEQTP